MHVFHINSIALLILDNVDGMGIYISQFVRLTIFGQREKMTHVFNMTSPCRLLAMILEDQAVLGLTRIRSH